MAVNHTGEPLVPRLDLFGQSGQVGQRAVAFEHLDSRPQHNIGDLEEVVHHPHAGETAFISRAGDPGQFCPDLVGGFLAR